MSDPFRSPRRPERKLDGLAAAIGALLGVFLVGIVIYSFVTANQNHSETAAPPAVTTGARTR